MLFNNTTQANNCSLERFPVQLIAICSVLAVLAALIMAANVAVISLYSRCRRLRTFTNLCLASLAVTHACEGLAAIPLIIACSLACEPGYLCLVMDLCQRFLAICTIAHLFIITTERYVAILQPLVYRRLGTEKKMRISLAVAWLASLSLSLIQLSWTKLDKTLGPSLEPQPTLFYDYFCVVAIVIPMLVFMVFAHSRIILVAKFQRRSLKFQCGRMKCSRLRSRFLRQKKGSCVYVAMVALYVLGWVPYFLLTIEADSPGADFGIPGWLRTALFFMKFTASLFNPLLYAFFKNDFKREMKRKVGMTTRRVQRQCCVP